MMRPLSPILLRDAAAECRKAERGNAHLDAMIFAAFGAGSYVDALGIAPPYTRSLDGARMLVPWGWYWRIGETTLYAGWAFINAFHPDHCQPKEDEFGEHSASWQRLWTPELALCACCLEAWAFRFQRRYDWLAQRALVLRADA